VIEFSQQRWARIAAVGALVGALGLSACGRKGPLDLPPQASAVPGPDNLQAVPADSAAERDRQVGVSRQGRAVAPARLKEDRPFILDWLVQ